MLSIHLFQDDQIQTSKTIHILFIISHSMTSEVFYHILSDLFCTTQILHQLRNVHVHLLDTIKYNAMEISQITKSLKNF